VVVPTPIPTVVPATIPPTIPQPPPTVAQTPTEVLSTEATPTLTVTAVLTQTALVSGTLEGIELIVPGPVHGGDRLSVEYRWGGTGETGRFEIYLAVASSGSCFEGPLLYSGLLDGEPWTVNYYVGPWHAGSGWEDMKTVIPPPPWPDQFRICLTTEIGAERVWEEFLFEWGP
jgi:hypothetical protein